MTDVIDTVRAYILARYLPGEDPALLTEDMQLTGSGILDSLATIELVGFLEERFGIELAAHDVDPTHLGSLAGIAALVRRKQESGS